jgi:hypothetical protein
MKYTIKHGAIAACQYVILPNGKELSISDSPEEPNLKHLPIEVIAAINRQFGIVLSLPYGMRQAFIDNSIAFDVEVTE